jgi:hypothetical protein
MTRARRPNLYVINALTRRYAKAKGEMQGLLCDREAVRADMAHLGAVLGMFEPGIDLAAIRPQRPYKARRGRWTRTALDILKKANRPLKARELARLVMSRHGINADHDVMVSIACGLQGSLGKLAALGLVTITGKPRRWAIR